MTNEVEIVVKSTDKSGPGFSSAKSQAAGFGTAVESAADDASTALGRTDTAAKTVGDALDKLAAEADALDAKKADIEVTVDDSTVKPAMGDVETNVRSGAKAAESEVPVTVDDSKIDSGMDDVKSEVRSEAKAAATDVEVGVDTSRVEAGMSGVKSDVRSGARAASTDVEVGIDDSEVDSGMDDIAGKVKDGAKTAGVAAGAILATALWDSFNDEAAADVTAASLGLSPKQAARAGKVAGKVYAGAWGDSLEEVNAAVAAVMSSIDGMSNAGGRRLEGMTIKALDFAAAFDVDVSRAVQVVGQLIRTGLVKDANQGFDLLVAASQNVPAAVREDLLDAIDEYGPFFKALGMTGKEAFSILVRGARDGVYGIDKAGDAIKELTIRTTDMSSTSKEAYRALGLDANDMADAILSGGDKANRAFHQIIDGLLDIKDPSKQAKVALALFGTPLEDLSVEKIPAFLRGLRRSQDELGGARREMGKVEGASKRMGKQLNSNTKTDITTWVRTLKQGVKDFIGGIVQGDWGRAYRGVRTVFSTIKDIVRDNWRLIAVLTGFGVVLVVEQVIKHWDRIKEKVRDVGGSIRDTVSNLWSSVADRTTSGLDRVWDRVTGVWGRIVDYIRSIPGKLAGVFDNIWSGITGGLRDAVNSALGLPMEFPGWDWPGPGGIGPRTLIPALARGGIARKPTLAVVGDGPTDEAIVPLDGRHGMGGTVTLEIVANDSEVSQFLATILRKYVRVKGGDVQAVLGR